MTFISGEFVRRALSRSVRVDSLPPGRQTCSLRHRCTGTCPSDRVQDETRSFEVGDIVMIPQGEAHVMSNGPASHPVDGEPMLPALLRGEIQSSRIGGNGEETRFLCGFLASDTRLIQPVLASLPRIVIVNIRKDPLGARLENMIRHAVEQASAAAPGNDVVLARLAEVLFAEVLRLRLLRLPPGRSGWLAGAADPPVGRAPAALHQRPSQPWTLDDLTKDVGMSRSALTERFSEYLGQGPMAYLTDWRLEPAADALRTTNRSVLQIAEEVGYESGAAFNRAFKRRFAEPPGRYRRSARERPAPASVGWNRLALYVRYAYSTSVATEFDPRKDAIDLRKHGVALSAGDGVLTDPLALTLEDRTSAGEQRFVTIGTNVFGSVMVVVWSGPGDNIRLTPVRKAEPKERRTYEERI